MHLVQYIELAVLSKNNSKELRDFSLKLISCQYCINIHKLKDIAEERKKYWVFLNYIFECKDRCSNHEFPIRSIDT